MGKRKKKKITKELVDLAKQFDDWRQTRAKRGPISEDLWESAVKMAQKYGNSPVIRLLRLNSGKLKRRLADADKTSALKERNGESNGFLELDVSQIPLSQPLVSPECVIEIEMPSKGKMTLRLNGISHFDAANFARMWWSQPS